MHDAEQEVLRANEAFYRAFATKDLEAMDALWAREAPCACIHPGWPALRGRQTVMAGWRASPRAPRAPASSQSGAVAVVLGETAYVLCRENVRGGRLVATNFFVREDGAWKIVHHQAGPVAAEAETEPDAEPEPEPEPED